MAFTTITCSCGLNGNATEADARQYIAWARQTKGKHLRFVRCPVGDSFHCYDTERSDEDRYLAGLADGRLLRAVQLNHPTRRTSEEAESPVQARCQKKRFATRTLAEICAPTGYSTYECPICGSWHQTSAPEKTEAAFCRREVAYETNTKTLAILRDESDAVAWVDLQQTGKPPVRMNVTDARNVARIILSLVPSSLEPAEEP